MSDSIQHMATQALRTIGIAFKEVDMERIDLNQKNDRGVYKYEEDEFTLVCIFGIRDTIREEVP